MPKATFSGDPRGGENPPVCHLAGYEFPLGEPIDVSDELAAKLAGNHHFRVDGAEVQIIEPQKRRGRPPKVRAEDNGLV